VDYLTEKRPQECLAATEMYFIREWPFKGRVNKTDTRTSFIENQGCLASWFAGQPGGVNVFAVPDDRGTRLTVDSSKRKYASTIDAWVRSELRATPV
jgi:hypothetical protein